MTDDTRNRNRLINNPSFVNDNREDVWKDARKDVREDAREDTRKDVRKRRTLIITLNKPVKIIFILI